MACNQMLTLSAPATPERYKAAVLQLSTCNVRPICMQGQILLSPNELAAYMVSQRHRCIVETDCLVLPDLRCYIYRTRNSLQWHRLL